LKPFKTYLIQPLSPEHVKSRRYFDKRANEKKKKKDTRPIASIKMATRASFYLLFRINLSPSSIINGISNNLYHQIDTIFYSIEYY
jgi:hypothetical protein